MRLEFKHSFAVSQQFSQVSIEVFSSQTTTFTWIQIHMRFGFKIILKSLRKSRHETREMRGGLVCWLDKQQRDETEEECKKDEKVEIYFC